MANSRRYIGEEQNMEKEKYRLAPDTKEMTLEEKIDMLIDINCRILNNERNSVNALCRLVDEMVKANKYLFSLDYELKALRKYSL